MVNCRKVENLVNDIERKNKEFVLLSLLTQLASDCLKKIKDEKRKKFPPKQEKFLFDKIKVQIYVVKDDLIQTAIRDLKFIGVFLRDYKVGKNVDFNKFLVECLLSSYKSMSNEIEISKKKLNEEKFKDFLEPGHQKELDKRLISSDNDKIERYLNIRRDCDSLYRIYCTIDSLSVKRACNVNRRAKSIEELPSTEEKRLATQRVFHIIGEFVKDTKKTPNLSLDVRQSLEAKGVPTKALSNFRDTLAHYQVFPLIVENDDRIKELFDKYFFPIQEVIRSTIIETEDRFVEKILVEKGKESKIDKSVVERLIESKSREGVQGLKECITTIRKEDNYLRMDNENKKFLDDLSETVKRMKSTKLPVVPVQSSAGIVSKKNSKVSDSIIEYINKSKLEAYNKLRDEVAPSLEIPVGKLKNLHGDVLKIAEVVDRLSYKDIPSPNNSILDNFLSLPILENTYVEIKQGTDNKVTESSLKTELERYFDAESFKNNHAYGKFKDSKATSLIDLVKNNISGESANKEKLIGFFESIGKSQDNYIPPEEYERLVNGLVIKDNIKEKLLSFSVGWRREKCVNLLRKNPPALKAIYDSIFEGKLIRSSVYDKLVQEFGLRKENDKIVKQRIGNINQKIEDLYSRRAKEEFGVLVKVNHPYAVESQMINVYSLSERASDKKKENQKKKKGGQEKKGGEEISPSKKLRNYLSHSDALITLEKGIDVGHQLVEVKNQETVKAILQDETSGHEKIERAMDIVKSHSGVKNISSNICLPDNKVKRSTRSASKNCIKWEVIDKISKGGAKNRDPDNIIIDSEKFIRIISSELEANEEKFSKFIALADESEVIGAHKNKVNMLTDKHRYLRSFERVGKVSGMVMHGTMAKTLALDILHGDYTDLAINVVFLIGNPALAIVADVASMKGARYILQGKAWRGKSLRIASPFISSAFSGYTVYNLINQVKQYREGDKDALVPIVGNSIELLTDFGEIGVQVGEVLGFWRGYAAFAGPVGMTVGLLVSTGTGIYKAVREVEKTDEYIHLTRLEKFNEGIRDFVGLGHSDEIGKLIGEKDGNNQAVKNATIFLKGHPQIQRYVFPSMRVEYAVNPIITICRYIPIWDEFDPICPVIELLIPKDSNSINILDNTVLLDQKRTDIKWSRARPDNLEGSNLFCLPRGDWESVPGRGTFYCDGAIGVEYKIDRTGNYTYINLGDGNDAIKGFERSSNIFVIGDGIKNMIGGNKDDNFIFEGRSVDYSHIVGSINGGGGIDTIDVGELTPHSVSSRRVGIYQVFADFRKRILHDRFKVNVTMDNINIFLGRNGEVDVVVSACYTKHVDGRGGENKNYLDSIIIPRDDDCSYDITVTVNPYTKVTNSATRGNFIYFVKGEKGKEAYIELAPSSQSNDTFIFNYTLTDVAAIDKSEKTITFSFVEEFYKREKKIDVNSSFNLTVSGADKNTTTYQLNDRTTIEIGQNTVRADQTTEKPIDSLVKDYSSIADKLEMFVVVHSNGEVLTIGNSNWDVFTNAPNATSHLVGGGGEDTFVITSGHEKLTRAKLPISDVVIYDFDQGNQTDTLDLNKIKKQLKKDIDREINTEVSKFHSDLLINLSLDDASKKEVVKIRLKGALENNWYKRVHVVLDNTFVIEQILDDFELIPQPLIFDDDNSVTMYLINPKDVAKGGKITVKREVGDYIFARDNDALVITNTFDSSADKNNLLTIILNDFYHKENIDKMSSLKIEFDDKRILLRKEMGSIDSMIIRNYSELKRKFTIDSYKAVMYAIKEEKLFEAIEANNIDEVTELIDHDVRIDARNNDGQTPLHIAAFHGNLEVVKYLVDEKHADVNAKDNSGIKPLHCAASGGSLNVVKYIIEKKGANVEVTGNFGLKLLHYAALGGNLEVVKYLVEEKHADVHVKDNSGITPLHYAALGGSLGVVTYLVDEKHADVNATDNSGIKPLHLAASGGSLEVVKYLVEEKHADVNVKANSGITPLHCAVSGSSLNVVKHIIEKKGNVNVRGYFGRTLFNYADFQGNLQVIKYLIEEKGADIEAVDDASQNPLHLAASGGNLEVVTYLIEERGIDINAVDNASQNPLHFAARDGNLEVVRYLIEERGIDIGAMDYTGKVPLHSAALDGRLEVVTYLIEEAGANIYARDGNGMEPLHSAALDGRLEVVTYLIEEAGANIYARDSNGMVPLHIAAGGGRLEVVKYLVEEEDMDIDVADYYNQLPLHLAADKGRLEVVKYFVRKGADVNLRSNYGMTPLLVAAQRRYLEMVEYLIEKGAKIDIKVNDKTYLNILKSNGFQDVVDSIVEKLTRRLFDAVYNHDLHDVQDLINQGFSVNDEYSWDEPLLHNAVSNGLLKLVKYLTKGKQFDFNAKKDDFGRTMLHLAALHGKLGIVKYLVEEKHADVNVKDNSGATPLHLAAAGGFDVTLEIIKYLVEEKHADVNVKDNSGATPLHLAAAGDFAVTLEVIKYLVDENHADVNAKDYHGSKPLNYVPIGPYSKVAEFLEKKTSADLDVGNFAAGTGHNDIVRKLNEKRETPRQHKRSHRHSSRRLFTTDSSNQPEIATSNAREKSLSINNFVGSIVKFQESSAPSEAASSNHPIRQKRRKRHNNHSRHEDGVRMRMHRVRHRHRRVQKRDGNFPDSHYYIDQPKIAASCGTRPSSWINGLLDWIKEKGGGLVSSVVDKFAAKESGDSKSGGIHACSVRLEKMYSATIPNIPQSRKSQGVPKGNIPNTSWSGWSSNREKITSNATDAPEMNTTVLNNALILGDLAVRLVNGTRHKQPIHENLLSLREKSIRFIDENMIMRTIEQGKEKYGGLDVS